MKTSQNMYIMGLLKLKKRKNINKLRDIVIVIVVESTLAENIVTGGEMITM